MSAITVASNSREQVAKATAGIKSVSPFGGGGDRVNKKNEPRSSRLRRESRGQLLSFRHINLPRKANVLSKLR
jgi:hypothetical protein